ncbi:hypothetical protein I302_103147 [Kwoniella bestiolae CBS 10118]|uniref:Uncharacterized protein n=1 Tax=Kwoniella bestiolae CBS 10118 TaxID=1296100 RepID=A0AAJ8K517_9TREE
MAMPSETVLSTLCGIVMVPTLPDRHTDSRVATISSIPTHPLPSPCITDESYILPFPQTVLVDCDVGSYFIYRYDPIVSPSQAVRKRQKQQKILQIEEQGSLCPEGLEACPVSRDGAQSDYECIDTTLELESCGGCDFEESSNGVD